MPDNGVAAYLESFVSAERTAKIDAVLERRTKWLSFVLEDIYHPHNASAVVRTCECFGLQELFVIQNHKRFKFNTDVVRGAAKWVDVTKFDAEKNDNTMVCLQSLKERGYRIAATTLRDAGTVGLEDVPIDQPLALCFGTEETGLSDTAHDSADYLVHIPMEGFTRSLNISVCAALAARELGRRVRASEHPWRLTEKEKLEIRFDWLKKSVKHPETLIKSFKKYERTK